MEIIQTILALLSDVRLVPPVGRRDRPSVAACRGPGRRERRSDDGSVGGPIDQPVADNRGDVPAVRAKHTLAADAAELATTGAIDIRPAHGHRYALFGVHHAHK